MSIRSELDSLPETTQRLLRYALDHEIQQIVPIGPPSEGKVIAVHLGDSDPRFQTIETAGSWSIARRR